MSATEIALIILAALLAIIGWGARTMWAALDEKVDKQGDRLDAIPEKYATKSDLKELGDRIDNNLRDIKTEIAAGNRMQQTLLTALLSEERRQGAGIHNGMKD